MGYAVIIQHLLGLRLSTVLANQMPGFVLMAITTRITSFRGSCAWLIGLIARWIGMISRLTLMLRSKTLKGKSHLIWRSQTKITIGIANMLFKLVNPS